MLKERMPANQKEEVAMRARTWSVAVVGMSLALGAGVFAQEVRMPARGLPMRLTQED